MVAMVDGMLQDVGGLVRERVQRYVATLSSQWTTVNGATPKYGSYH